MKTCFKCGATKAKTEFYAHSKMADGYLGKCKECAKVDSSRHREDNIDKVRKYDRERGKLPHRIALSVKNTRKKRQDNPLYGPAHVMLRRAVEKGIVLKPSTCSVCGNETRLVGHHRDYAKPLDVVWVCDVCHKKMHKGGLK